MACVYCEYCDGLIDLDIDVEHFTDEDFKECAFKSEDDLQFRMESQIKGEKINRATGKEDPRNPDKK